MSELDFDATVPPPAREETHSTGATLKAKTGPHAISLSNCAFLNRLGVHVRYRVYRPDHGGFDRVVVVAGAMGVQGAKYHAFARHLARHHLVVTYDPAGAGDSLNHLYGPPIHLTDWAGDLAHLIRIISAEHGQDVVCIGHGVGGQLAGLVDPSKIEKIVLVAAQNRYWRYWAWRHRPLILLGWGLIYATTRLTKRLAIMRWMGLETLPAGVALDWVRWAMHDGFTDFHGVDLDARFARFNGPLLSVYPTDDPIYAPLGACRALLNKFKSAKKDTWVLSPGDWGVRVIGHSGFFTSTTGEKLWDKVSDWIKK